jgi:hypothetical protein
MAEFSPFSEAKSTDFEGRAQFSPDKDKALEESRI